MKKRNKTGPNFLFPNNSFIMGMGSVLNIAGNYFSFSGSDTELEADEKAIHADWSAVGQDIEEAIQCYQFPEKD